MVPPGHQTLASFGFTFGFLVCSRWSVFVSSQVGFLGTRVCVCVRAPGCPCLCVYVCLRCFVFSCVCLYVCLCVCVCVHV